MVPLLCCDYCEGNAGGSGHKHVLFAILVSRIWHVNDPEMMIVAVPFFADRSAVICTRRSCLMCEIVTVQPRTVTVPVPVATTCPLQQN